MVKGLIFALLACFVWGLIFPIPVLLGAFNPVEVALGRYFFLGLISFVIASYRWKHIKKSFTIDMIKKALVLGLVGNVIYYIAIVSGLRFSHPAVVALILGISPIGIGLLGNIRQRDIELKNLFIPFSLTLLGLICVNIPALTTAHLSGSLSSYIFGILAAFIALGIWCWFAVYNAQFLKSNPQVSSSDWSTLIGITTFAWVLIVFTFLYPFIYFDEYFSLNPEMMNFYLGCGLLGVFCSWLGSYLWNKTTCFLPITLAGQMLIFETLFGISFIYIIEHKFPSYWEMVGILAMLSGTWVALQQFRKIPTHTQTAS